MVRTLRMSTNDLIKINAFAAPAHIEFRPTGRVIRVRNGGKSPARYPRERLDRLHRDTGSVSAAKFGGYKEFALAAHEELVRSLIGEQPDITLAELEARLAKKKVLVGKSSISRFLDHLELPFKKSAGRRAGSAGRRRRA